MKSSSRGVTLIELMIVIVILAIISSIAIPTYRNYMMRANRSEAMSALLTIRAAQEKFFLQNNRYAVGSELSTASPGGLGIPATTVREYYSLVLVSPDPAAPAGVPSFIATATPQGGQAKDTKCPSFTLNDQGVKGPTSTAAACWK